MYYIYVYVYVFTYTQNNEQMLFVGNLNLFFVLHLFFIERFMNDINSQNECLLFTVFNVFRFPVRRIKMNSYMAILILMTILSNILECRLISEIFMQLK